MPNLSPQRPLATDAARVELVDRARESWIAKLIDLSRRNNLLFYRDLQTGTLDLSKAPDEQIHALLKSGAEGAAGVPLRRLVQSSEEEARGAIRLREIAGRALANLEERGLDTLFLSLGLASWDAGDGGRQIESPILLMPLSATPSGRESRSWSLRRNGDLKLNDVLLHALDAQHGLKLDAETLLPEVQGDDEGEDFDLEPLFSALRSAAEDVPGFAVTPRYIISNFHFQKLAIVRDLRELTMQLAAHPIIAGIAGDLEARGEARGSRGEGNPRELDAVLPDNEFLVLDSDSTQQQAVAFALAGKNGVISGPPGTGKSQTIANLVAEMSARGKTVLFVAEKRAALDVVLDRLKRLNLGHLCLDLHGADISRKLVALQLKRSLDLVRTVTLPDVRGVHRQFHDRREKLNSHVRRLHAVRPPSGLSIYQIFGRLQRLPADLTSRTRWRGPDLAGLDEERAQKIEDLLDDASRSIADLVTGESSSPWIGVVFPDATAARAAMDRARRLADTLWPAFTAALARVESDNAIQPPRTLADVRRVIGVCRHLRGLLDRYELDLFLQDLPGVVVKLAPASGTASGLWATFTNREYRRARSTVAGLRHAGKVPARILLSEVKEAAECGWDWTQITVPNTRPHPPVHHEVLEQTLNAVTAELEPLLRVFASERPGLTIEDLSQWLPRLAADTVTPYRIVKLGEFERELAGLKATAILEEIRATRVRPDVWCDLFRHARLSSCLDEAYQQEPSIPAFVGRSHDAIVDEFRRLDRQRLEVAVDRVRRAHAERVLQIRNREREQDALVSREADKKSRHLPLRRLLSDAPEVLLALRPCWMASPLSVSQLIPGDRPLFDVVIFDEASQVLPQDAVTSLLRGRQAIVAGDRKQLPPTTFFAASEDEESEGDEAVAGFESILDMMSAFLEPAWSLDWHYRSRDEALIAFSNRHIYSDRLVTFPGPGGAPVVTHHHVPFVPAASNEESATAEVKRVVELVLDHARRRSGDTLGVIAMGIKHAHRVEAAVEQAGRDFPELDAFFAPDRPERFFIKNLERVQGDERDAIILTVGYGKDASGKLPYRFGPLLADGGERRLNVAVTRARKRIDVVSSFTHHDMEPGRSTKRGVELLRAYLEYAASRGANLDTSTTTGVALNDFEQAVYDALVARGMKLLPQLGTSRYRIDLVAQHPQQPGKFVLAIECDGATYHSAPTARDRDRLRQQHLEALGWTFHRIWSTDWFLRREEEIERTMKAFEKAVSRSERPPDPAPPTTPGNSTLPSPPSPAAVAVGRGPRPPISTGRGDITDYSEHDLERMVQWVRGDGLPTDDQIVREVSQALGFQRVGNRIDAAIRRAIRKSP